MNLPEEKACGVIVVLKGNEYKFLLLKQHNGLWTFPKGHMEENETPKDTALRELYEETGISAVELQDFSLIREQYKVAGDRNYLKINQYFIGFVNVSDVTIQEAEIAEYRWVTYDEAMKTFESETRKETLKSAKAYLDKYGSAK